jgi:hypothetical protein
MILVDSSVIVSALRDRTGAQSRKFDEFVGDRKVFVSRFTQLELLAGARMESEWRWLSAYLQSVGLCDPSAPLGGTPPAFISICDGKVERSEALSTAASRRLRWTKGLSSSTMIATSA